jgi:hypothetical protein
MRTLTAPLQLLGIMPVTIIATSRILVSSPIDWRTVLTAFCRYGVMETIILRRRRLLLGRSSKRGGAPGKRGFAGACLRR